ncbi:CARNS1 [Symbiodinium sp. CCMP2456]|nr:CARNS1 [Symbiodinium sp. CCMP2456]
MATEVLKISDGTTMEICRLPDVDDQTWAEVRAYVEGNPDTAKTLKSFSKNPDAMRGWLQTQAIAEHYSAKLANGDTPVQDKVKSLEADPELAAIFEDIKKNGMEAAMKYYQDEELMLKISQKMGGLPSELQPVLQKIEDTSLTLHEAAKKGDLAAVQQFLDKNKPLDAQDHKGITPLGYAIGANRIAVVKKLLDSRANPYAVDSSGNSGLHYAAGYGRKELLEQLMRGATVVFVTAGLPGKRFTFEIAASLGIKPVILEHPDSWSRSLVDEGLAAKFIPVDMTQPSEDIFNQALEHIKNLGEDGLTGTADGIASFVELSVPLAARLAEALGLPGLRPAAVDSARNKHATRACLKTAGLPTPRNFLIDDKSKLKEAGTAVGFPAVLKPVSGAASLGVKKVTNSVEMEKCYKEIVDELSTLVVSSGALVQGSPDNAGLNAQESGVDLTVLMEQFLDGPEVDVDVVMSEGRLTEAKRCQLDLLRPGLSTLAMSETSARADLNTALVAYSILYACLVLVGGIIGFVKAKSKASLIASTIVSLVLVAIVYATVQVNAFYGGCVMCVFSLVLVRMFFQKFNKSGEEKLNEPLTGDGSQKKFMPFGLLTVLTLGSSRGQVSPGSCHSLWPGEYVYACVADNGPTLEPYFNETWACCPSLLPKDQQVALRDLGVQCIKALGFTCGVFHVELKYTSHGPQLIEVNARMGGGQVHECNRLTWGVDLVEETMLCALGIPSRPCVPREPVSGTAYCYVNAMKSGTVTDISKLEELRKRDNVVWAKPLTRVGAKAVGPADGLPTWLCDLFVQGKTAKDALAYLQAIEKENPVLVA